MIEYSKDNRFPFHTREDAVSVYFDDCEDLQELDFIYEKIVEHHPSLMAENFYASLIGLESMHPDSRLPMLKQACDSLLQDIRSFLADESFIHQMHDIWGIGIDKVIGTLYAVYGYYFYTGKRTANVIKKVLDGYSR